MKKRLISIAIAALLLCAAFTVAVSAREELPESKPKELFTTFVYPNEGSEFMKLHYLVPESVCRFIALSSGEKIEKYGFDVKCVMQVDWSVGGERNWHYNNSWDSGRGDFRFYYPGVDFIGEGELFWLTYQDHRQMLGDAVVTRQNEYGESYRVFDFENRELYIRARFTYIDGEGQVRWLSDWSDSFRVNDAYEGKAAGELGSSDFGHAVIGRQPVFADGSVYFDLSFDGDAMETAWSIKTLTGMDMFLQSEVRINDGEWEPRIISEDTNPYGIGARMVWIGGDAEAGKVEFRCRLYYGGNPERNVPAAETAWSDNIVIENGVLLLAENVDEPEDDWEKPEGKKISLIYIWIGIGALALILIVVVLLSMLKGKKRTSEIQKSATERLQKNRESGDAFMDAVSKKDSGQSGSARPKNGAADFDVIVDDDGGSE
ncbi:MAG: hypothetical protein FWF05_09035 [Oscillospiraceae bacterium]|nr:hypothetical protein [Oscillospiraceae bacterium]